MTLQNATTNALSGPRVQAVLYPSCTECGLRHPWDTRCEDERAAEGEGGPSTEFLAFEEPGYTCGDCGNIPALRPSCASCRGRGLVR